MMTKRIYKYALVVGGIITTGVIFYGSAHLINSAWYEHSIPRDLKDAALPTWTWERVPEGDKWRGKETLGRGEVFDIQGIG
jgi:hypothetical protein